MKRNTAFGPTLLNSLSIKKTYDVGNPSPDLTQAHKCGGVKPVNEIPALF
jgi:hypothetical protein